MFKFAFNGGVKKPAEHTNEKFMLFFLVEGKEIPLYQMKRDGLVLSENWDSPNFTTNFKYMKLFISQKGFGIRSRFYSFYLEMFPEDDPAAVITITPFSLEKTGFFFKGKCSFVNKERVKELLDSESESLKFLEQQGILAIDVLKAIVKVDRSEMKRGVRGIRIKG